MPIAGRSYGGLLIIFHSTGILVLSDSDMMI
jgi:hypothetical protein